MTYSILLIVHIIGALGLFSISGVSVFSIVMQKIAIFKKLFGSVIAINILQVVTGLGLFINPGNSMSGKQFCMGLGGYLLFSVILGSVLYRQINSENYLENKNRSK
jgi:hypothetical protein